MLNYQACFFNLYYKMKCSDTLVYSKIKRVLLFSFTCFFTSCATLIHTPYQKVTIVAEPRHTEIYVNNRYAGMDSVQLTLKRNSNAFIQLKNDYCIHKDILLTPQNSKGGAFLYIVDSMGGLLTFVHPILGGLAVFIPVSIDFITGSHHTLNPYSKSAKAFTLKVHLQSKCPE